MYLSCSKQELVSHPIASASLHPKPDWIACGLAVNLSAKQINKTKQKHLQCEAHWTRSAVEVQSGPWPYRPQHFIHQKLHPNPTNMFKHLQCEAKGARSAVEVQHGSSPQAIATAALHPSEASRKSDKHVHACSLRSPPGHISRWGSAWLFPSGLQCEARRTRSAVEVQHPLRLSTRSPPDQISCWCLACFFPWGHIIHSQRFHQKLHLNPTKMFKHLQCEAHRTISAADVQHG